MKTKDLNRYFYQLFFLDKKKIIGGLMKDICHILMDCLFLPMARMRQTQFMTKLQNMTSSPTLAILNRGGQNGNHLIELILLIQRLKVNVWNT